MAAQGYQESQLNQDAKSQVGAIGVMQIMPATGEDMKVGDVTQTEATSMRRKVHAVHDRPVLQGRTLAGGGRFLHVDDDDRDVVLLRNACGAPAGDFRQQGVRELGGRLLQIVANDVCGASASPKNSPRLFSASMTPSVYSRKRSPGSIVMVRTG